MFTVRFSKRLLRLGFLPRVLSHASLGNEAPQGPNFAAITNGAADLEHKLKVLTLEIDVMRQEGHQVPDESFLKDKHWKELLELPSLSRRRKYLIYLFKTAKTIENRKFKKEKAREEYLAAKALKDENETSDRDHNTILLRVYDTTMNNLYNNRLIQAMKFGEKLIVDCGYDNHMTKRENVNCAKQLTFLFAENRNHTDPFDLHFCNVNKDGILMQKLHGHIATMHEPWFPLTLHESSYLDNFPKEQLVYLTPHCREELLEYDHDAIYIIGAIVDKVNTEPLSLAKAKREGLKMAKFPLERYLQWGCGSGKSLTLNHVVTILLDFKLTGDWKYALRHVPRRKIADSEVEPAKNKHIWNPTRKINFDNLTFKGGNKERLVKVRSIMED